jgi:hypothetical protein
MIDNHELVAVPGAGSDSGFEVYREVEPGGIRFEVVTRF